MTTVNTPIKIGSLTVKNRLTFAPTVKFDWTDGSGLVIDRFVRHYEERAKYGCGLICVEATCVLPDGRLAPTQLGLWEDNQIEGHRKITEACHRYGAAVLVQIHHGGINTHPQTGEPKGPSAIEWRRGQTQAMTIDEIHHVREAFIAAAVRAKKAGYDGVQLHACHGYLFNQFLSLTTNRREDEYGCGSIENRTRLACEVIAGIRRECGKDFIISARTPGAEPNLEDGIRAAELYVAAGCDYLQVSDGIGPYDVPEHDESLPYNKTAELGVKLHEHFRGRVPVSCVNGIIKEEQVKHLIENELVDTVDLARALLADPKFSDSVLNGGECVHCFNCKICFWSPFMPRRCPAVAKRHKEDPDCVDYTEDNRPIPDLSFLRR